MKKVVVVVAQAKTYVSENLKVDEFREETFEGKNLEVLDTSTVGVGAKLLIVRDGSENLAVFRDWMYWKKLE